MIATFTFTVISHSKLSISVMQRSIALWVFAPKNHGSFHFTHIMGTNVRSTIYRNSQRIMGNHEYPMSIYRGKCLLHDGNHKAGPIIMTCILNGVLSGFCQSDNARLGCIPSISSSGHNMLQGFPPRRAFYNLCLSAPWLGCWSFQSTV